MLVLVLAGCASSPNKAPVEDRKPPARVSRPATPPAVGASAGETSAGGVAEPLKVLPGAENAGKPGYYTVKPGDTLLRIALDNGQPWRDVVRWNGLENPNLIEVGQVLRVVSPAVDASAVAARGVASARVEARPLDAKAAVPAAGAASAPAGAATAAKTGVSAPLTAQSATTAAADDDVVWAWPANGAVNAKFEEGRNNGLEISGKAGDPVLAAADGRVMYVGADLRGLGNLVIVKHNNTYLTAYAHNRALLVKEDQVVRKGQKIAEMGSSDSDRVQLHFEIRRVGKPIDPARLLPAR